MYYNWIVHGGLVLRVEKIYASFFGHLGGDLIVAPKQKKQIKLTTLSAAMNGFPIPQLGSNNRMIAGRALINPKIRNLSSVPNFI